MNKKEIISLLIRLGKEIGYNGFTNYSQMQFLEKLTDLSNEIEDNLKNENN